MIVKLPGSVLCMQQEAYWPSGFEQDFYLHLRPVAKLPLEEKESPPHPTPTRGGPALSHACVSLTRKSCLLVVLICFSFTSAARLLISLLATRVPSGHLSTPLPTEKSFSCSNADLLYTRQISFQGSLRGGLCRLRGPPVQAANPKTCLPLFLSFRHIEKALLYSGISLITKPGPLSVFTGVLWESQCGNCLLFISV